MADERSLEQFAGPAEFRAWLAANHAISNGMWLKIAKKVSYTLTGLWLKASPSAVPDAKSRRPAT
jgi:uncharacterized protein YdeI (YjbR/CyaY-like superfamily)